MNSHKHGHIYTVTLTDTDTDTILDTHSVDTYSSTDKRVDMYTDMLTDTPGGTRPSSHLPHMPSPPAFGSAVGQTDRSFSRGAGDGLAGDFSGPVAPTALSVPPQAQLAEKNGVPAPKPTVSAWED